MGIETMLMAGIGAMGAMGELQKGQSAKEAADYNAAVSRQRAATERDAAAAEMSDFFRKESRSRASGIAARGGSGVTMEGSPLMVDEATVREIALGASRIRHGGEVRGTRLEQEANLDEMRGKHAKDASYLAAGKSMLTAGGKMYGGGGFSV
jgi:hypothetical protein